MPSILMLFDHPLFGALKRLTGFDVTFHPLGTGAPFWSVAVEWWIYIAFGLIMLRLVARKKLGVLGWALLLFAGAVPLWSMVGHRGLALAWLVGMAYAMAELAIEKSRPVFHRVTSVLSLATACASLRLGNYNVFSEFFAVSLSVGVMSGYFGWSRRTKPTRSIRFVRSVRFISDYSYSLYLIHFSILIYLGHYFLHGRPAGLAIPTAVVSCNIFAILFWYAFERHYPRVRRFLYGLLPKTASSQRAPGDLPS